MPFRPQRSICTSRAPPRPALRSLLGSEWWGGAGRYQTMCREESGNKYVGAGRSGRTGLGRAVKAER